MAKPKRGADGFFSVTITLGRDANGKRIRKRIRAKTLAGLNQKRSTFERERALGVVTVGRRPTLETVCRSWLEDVVKPRNRSRVYDRYQGDVENHVIPHLGHIRVDLLNALDVQRWVNELAKSGRKKPKEGQSAGLAPRSVRNAHATLRNALDSAVTWGLVVKNVATLVQLPKAGRPRILVLSPQQARQLLQAVIGDRLEALYWVVLLLGLREGEVLGLRWADIDLSKKTLHVRYAVQRQKQPEGPSKIVFVSTKTEAGQRLLPIPDTLLNVLQAHKVRQDEERSWDEWKEHDLVFPSEVGTPIENTNLVSRHFKPALKRAGLPDMRFHDLRHSCATLLLSMGVDHNTVSGILGHTSASFTLATYGHALPEVTRSAIDELGDVLRADRVLELTKQKRR